MVCGSLFVFNFFVSVKIGFVFRFLFIYIKNMIFWNFFESFWIVKYKSNFYERIVIKEIICCWIFLKRYILYLRIVEEEKGCIYRINWCFIYDEKYKV